MRFRRILPAALTAVAMAALPAVAAAHVHLTGSTPEPGDNLDTAPSEVVLTFDDELDPDGSRFTVTDAGGTEVGAGDVDLSVAARDTLRGEVTIDEPGIYTVSYTARGLDGHDVAGEFSFGYRAGDPVPTPEPDDDHHGSPDTALPMPVAVPVTLVAGAALVVGAGALAARRAVLR